MNWYLYPLVVLAGAAAGFINVLAGSGSLITLPLPHLPQALHIKTVVCIGPHQHNVDYSANARMAPRVHCKTWN